MDPLNLIAMNLTVGEISTAYPDLTPDEQKVLLNIRKRKEELLQEINQLKDELSDVNSEIEAMDTEEGAKLKTLQMGKKKFNMDPKKGVQYLISHDLIKETPIGVAAFLYKGEGLNKTMIGDYLGERHDFNEAVLKSFVELHDFTDLILVQALRQFLWSFRLPGEAQKIDRMMESFAQR
jgi:cytohesin